ncbi:MAG: serine/threonine-protein kinase, partial [Planctomycetota bacterium]
MSTESNDESDAAGPHPDGDHVSRSSEAFEVSRVEIDGSGEMRLSESSGDLWESIRSAPATPDAIGPYQIVGRLGEGGMGVVYEARQTEPVQRSVALKVLKRGHEQALVRARFELERRALAAMNHSCIAKVLDAGSTETGEPYFVMELIDGSPLTQYCDTQGLALRERVELFQQVCSGVQHAHQKGVMHRDLKPANILVVRDGELALPKVVDFGLAKATNRELTTQTILTEGPAVLGTPEYMAPEQVDSGGEASTRASIA